MYLFRHLMHNIPTDIHISVVKPLNVNISTWAHAQAIEVIKQKLLLKL